MKTADFFFDLPPHLIAQRPAPSRGNDRLMVLNRLTGLRQDRMFSDLPALIEPGTLMVFNNSRVRKARIFGEPHAEFLLLEKLSTDGAQWRCMAKHAKRRRIGDIFTFPGNVTGKITACDGEFRIITFTPPIDDAWLEQHGHVPLPPYIRRDDENVDQERYQTVYARETGSAAAPTAGLHFTENLLAALEASGVESAFVTLHVGLGTFLPVRAENIEDHVMHREVFSISGEAAEKINRAKAQGRKILAVGTTSVRVLESAWRPGGIETGEGATDIFIYPGYQFRAVDQLLTNFHTPGSTLLMLAAAFAGLPLVLETYREAVEKNYRFFSYGDAMVIL